MKHQQNNTPAPGLRDAIRREINSSVIKPVKHDPENKELLWKAKESYKKHIIQYNDWIKEIADCISDCAQPKFNLKLSLANTRII